MHFLQELLAEVRHVGPFLTPRPPFSNYKWQCPASPRFTMNAKEKKKKKRQAGRRLAGRCRETRGAYGAAEAGAAQPGRAGFLLPPRERGGPHLPPLAPKAFLFLPASLQACGLTVGGLV